MIVNAIRDKARIEAKTVLHLGCGAGANDYILEPHDEITGIDISQNMAEIARALNPATVYDRGGRFNICTQHESLIYPTGEDYVPHTGGRNETVV